MGGDDYKEKLRNFLDDKIPMMPQGIVSGEPKRPPYDAAFKKQLEDQHFNLPTNELFLKYTDTPQLTMVRNWATGGIMTACNGLAGRCGRVMGAKDNLGRFPLEEFLGTIGKGHAWAPANRGARPAYGDIFRAVKFHMGVSLGFEGEDWITVEAGHGGPKLGYDVLQRRRKQFDPGTLQGWCDMRLYLDPRPPLPDWWIGTWVVYHGDESYYYRFTKYYEAFQYPWKPLGKTGTAQPVDKGTVSNQGVDTYAVKWQKEGWIEKFTYDRFDSFPGLNEKMTGSTYRGEQLQGVRM
jgi:hypothetical protein